MDEQNIHQPAPYTFPPRKEPAVFPTGRGELVFGVWTLIFSMALCNCLFFAGADLGFGLSALALLGGTCRYLHDRGHRFDWYSASLLALSGVLAAGYIRSDDIGMKFLAALVLMAVPGLSFCIAAGQNRRSPAGFLSLLDSPRATFALGFGCMGEAGRGIRVAFRSAGTLGNKAGAIALGLLIALPVVAILIPLLVSADAAFEGLLALLPDLDAEEAIITVCFGSLLTMVLYTRGLALHHREKKEAPPKARTGLNPLTVNTALLAAALVYGVYLASQLAYVSGGFSGILPEDYTLAEYARRGFFEMAWLCAMNLGIIALAVGLVAKTDRAPLTTRLICLFLGLVTVFLVSAASAKMLLYIRSFGLTRLRVLTEVFMLWLGVSTVLVCLWLFHPRLPYMKLVVVLAMVLCAGLFWADVDTQVARYNVRAYQEGRLETVDLGYLSTLSSGAVPYIRELAEDPDPQAANRAKLQLDHYPLDPPRDLRGWNWTRHRALEILNAYREDKS